MTPFPLLLAASLPIPPPIPDDLAWLPPPAVCRADMAFNRSVRDALRARQPWLDVRGRLAIDRAVSELDHAWHVLDWASVASGPDLNGQVFPVEQVRARLRELLGEDFDLRVMPAVVPLWALEGR